MIDRANAIGLGVAMTSRAELASVLLPRLVWVAGLLSTIYLVGWAALLVLYSVEFSGYLPSDQQWQKVWSIGMDAIPLCCFAATGFVGLKFWPRGRFRHLGLSAILVQTALAIYAYMHPLGILAFRS